MTYYVYIMTNQRHTVLYTGITNDIVRRSFEHKTKDNKKSFTARYNCNKLVYYEEFAWKADLIAKMNTDWKDLSEGWFDKRELEFAKSLEP